MARAPWQPGLFEGQAPPPANSGPLRALAAASLTDRHVASRLWLGLHFPALPLAALPEEGTRPRAILSQAGRQARVLICDPAASRQGVRPGLPANAALALLPELDLLPRESRLEQRLLLELADLAMEFTPCVSLAGPATLLLEIGGSLKLFGTAAGLRARVLEALHARGLQAGAGIAPTARAAHWLAFAMTNARVLNRGQLAGQLGRLQLASLPWPEARQRQLQEMGVETLADCVRLPREGLARRLGTRLLEELDQAYGRRPEALEWHRPEQHFHERVELEHESREARQLTAVLVILVEALAREMRLRQRSAWRVWLHCEHRDQPATRLRLGLLQATAEPSRLQELGRLQLLATALPAPVIAVSLHAALDAVLAPVTEQLLDSGMAVTEDRLAFVERLRARLGANAVHGLRTHAEHRPELAWQAVHEPGSTTGRRDVSRSMHGRRPLWMLPAPTKLREVGGRPVFQGVLQICRGPERIETGWWDGGDIRRDYYVASNHRGIELWVYRDLRERNWYLHGFFG